MAALAQKGNSTLYHQLLPADDTVFIVNQEHLH
jgi:hypothetical protein